MINFLLNNFLIETICSDPSYDEPSSRDGSDDG